MDNISIMGQERLRVILQNQVKDQMLMSLEAHNSIWQFPPERIVQMLSPRTAYQKIPTEKRTGTSGLKWPEDYEIETDKPEFQAACDAAFEKWQYDAELRWLGGTSQPGDTAESNSDRDKSWPDSADASETAFHAPFGHLISHCVTLGCSALLARNFAITPLSHAEYICEVKPTWFEIVEAFGAVFFDRIIACPKRAFVLMVGYNYEDDEARFMIWHPKGISATTNVKLKSTEGQKMFLKLVMTTLLWREPKHCGLPEDYEVKKKALDSFDATYLIRQTFWRSQQTSAKVKHQAFGLI